MIFTHDDELALTVIVELVNTDPESGGPELLPDVASLRDFVERYEISEVGNLRSADLLAVRELRPRLRAVFEAPEIHDAALRVNDLVSTARVSPRLTDHGGYGWHVHYFAPGATVAEHIAVDGAIALAHVIAEGEQERLQVCEAPDCSRVLVDLSRNRCKRYCDSRTCGNRLHVAAYRERRRAVVG